MDSKGHEGDVQMKSPRLTDDDLRTFLGNREQQLVRGGRSLPSENKRVVPYGASAVPAPYKSKWEATYASKLELEKQAGIIRQYWYEPFSLWLPGKVRYKPDFLIQYPAGLERSLEIVEVKGWSKNRRDGMTRLKIAAALFPCFVWRLVYRTKNGGWDGECL